MPKEQPYDAKRINKNILTIQGVFIGAMVLSTLLIFLSFIEFKRFYGDLEKEELQLLVQTRQIENQIGRLRSKIFIASLREGRDVLEMEEIELYARKLFSLTEELLSLAQRLDDPSLTGQMEELARTAAFFHRIGKEMPAAFMQSFEEGMDSLGAADSLNDQIQASITLINQRVMERYREKMADMDRRIRGAMLVLLAIGVSAILLSAYIYFRNMKLKKLNLYLDELVDRRTRDLQTTLNLLEEYKHAIDLSVIVIRTDTQGEIQYANREFCRLTGYRQEELEELRFYDMVLQVSDGEETIPGAYQNGASWQGSCSLIQKNGRTLYLQTTLSPITDSEGKVLEYLAIMQDITQMERQRLEKLEESVDRALDIRHEEMLAQLPLPALILDEGSTILAANRRFSALLEEEAPSLARNIGEGTLRFDDLVDPLRSTLEIDDPLDWKEELAVLEGSIPNEIRFRENTAQGLFVPAIQRLPEEEAHLFLLLLAPAGDQ